MATSWGDNDPVVSAPVQTDDWGANDRVVGGGAALDLQGRPVLTAADALRDITSRAEAENRIQNTAYVPTPFGTFEMSRALAEPIATQAPRIALPLAAAIGIGSGVGTIPTLAAIGGAGILGSVAGQEVEKELGMRQQTSVPEALTEGAISAIPALRLGSVASPLARVGIRGAEGAAIGFGQDVAMRAVRGEEQDLGGSLRSAGLGAAIATPLGLGELGRTTPREAAVLERLKGKPLEMQKQIVEQEIKLGQGIDTPETQRKGLELKQQIDLALEQQKAAEAADKAAQTEIKQGQKALAESRQLQAEAMQPPEIPKSTQILMDEAKPPVLANVAAEAASQSGGSPFALQSKLNELTAAPAPAVVPELANPAVKALAEPGVAPVAPKVELVPVPEGTEFLYEQGGVKYYQMPDATTARGSRTVDVATLKAEGFDTKGLPKAPKKTTKTEEPTNAIREQEATGGVLRPETPQPQFDVGLQGVVGENRPETFTGDLPRVQAAEEPQVTPISQELRLNNAGIGLKPITFMSRAEKRAELDAAGITTYAGKPLDEANPAQISAAVGKLRRGQLTPEGDLTQRGAVSPALIAPAASTAAGAAYGATQGESPEERVRNAILYGSLGLGAGVTGAALGKKAFEKPLRNYKSPVLKDVATMLTPKEEAVPLFDKIADAASNFRYRFNTRFAPIGEAQRSLYKQAGREFTPNRYYDLERGFERLAGAPVQAEGEVELLQNIVDKIPKKDVPHLDTYLTLSRIEDRLVKTGEENARLMDMLGIAQAEVDAAVAANNAAPSPRNSLAVVDAQKNLNAAKDKLNKEFDRKRVGDWSINKARQGIVDLESEIGSPAFAAIRQAGQEYQDVMKRALQIQVDSGRMPQDLMDRVLASNDFYAPFKVLKYYEDEEGFVRGGGSRRIPSSEQLAKRITGIDDTDVRIGSPTNVAAEQIYKGYILAQKNRKLRELATLSRLDPDGDFVKLIGPDAEPRKGYEKVTYFVNGQKQTMEVERQIADSLNGLDMKETDFILRGLGRAAGIFKLGATGLSIPFNLANAFVFDPLRLATISRYGFRGPQDFAYTLYEWPKALFSSARGNLANSPDALYESWIRSGAANSTLARVMTPEAFSSRLPRDVKTGEVLAESNFGLGAPIKVAGLVSNTLEETTKLLGLQRAMRLEKLDKLPPAERARKWDEIVTELRNYAGSPDFSRAGVSMRPLNILMPFLNPRWQGFTADFSRLNPFTHGNAKDATAAWTRLGTLVGLPAAGLAVYNLSTPENERDFKNIPQQERDRYFHIPLYKDEDGKHTILDTGTPYYFKNKDGAEIRGYYRIPKREFPGLMANTIEDFVSYAKDNSPETFAELAANFGENFVQTASPVNIEGDSLQERTLSAASGLNPVLRLPLEVSLNRSLFTGRNIVPEGREKASPELQYTPQTPENYKQVAGALPEFAPEVLRSPAMLQHLTEGMTGSATRQFIAPKLSEGNPAGESSPLLGRFYRSERVESSDLLKGAEAAERGRADQRIVAQESAGKLADAILKLPTSAERQQAIQRAVQSGRFSPETFDYLKDELKDAQRGLTYEDRVVKRSYSVAGNFRAQYYLDKIAKMDATARREYLLDQRKKGLLTKEVVNQLGGLMRQSAGRN